MRKLTEEKKEILKYGICMGVVLFIVNVIYIGLQKDRGFAETIMPYFGLILFGYAAAGVLFFFFCFLYSERAEGGRIVEILSERHCRSIHNHELYAAVFPCRSCSCRQDACANDFSSGCSGNWWISHLGLQKSVDNVKKA